LIEQVDAVVIAGRALLCARIIVDLIALDTRYLIGIKPTLAVLLVTINEYVAGLYGFELRFCDGIDATAGQE
jgi:hypothetical protein